MAKKPQKDNTVLIIVALISVVGTVIAATITAIGNYNSAKLTQQIELTRIALASTSVTNSPAQITPQIINSPIPTVDADSTVYDNFNNPAFNGKWNTGLWGIDDVLKSSIEQKDGVLMLSRKNFGSEGLISTRSWTIDEIGFVEFKSMLDGSTETSNGGVSILFAGIINGKFWWISCGIQNNGPNNPQVTCGSIEKYSSLNYSITYNSWHTIRIETNSDTTVMTFFADGIQIGTFVHSDPEVFKKTLFSIHLYTWMQDGKPVIGYIDDVRTGTR